MRRRRVGTGLIHNFVELYNHGGFAVCSIHWALHDLAVSLRAQNRRELELLKKKRGKSHTLDSPLDQRTNSVVSCINSWISNWLVKCIFL
jgi:hypothetical protein